MQILDKAKTILSEAYGGPGAAIDIGMITMLLDMLLSLLKGCQGTPAKNIVGMPAANPYLARLRVRRHVRKELGGPKEYHEQDGERIVDTLIKAAAQAKPADIEELQQLNQTGGI